MNQSHNAQFLIDVLAEPGPDAVRDRLRVAFLAEGRRRRRVRTQRSTAGAMAALILLAAVIWRTAGTSEPPRYTLVRTVPGACPLVRTGDFGQVAMVRTIDLRYRVRELTDEQLLAIVAPHGGSLIGDRLVFRDPQAAASFFEPQTQQ